MYAYMLCTYDEHGPEHTHITTDRSRLPEMVDAVAAKADWGHCVKTAEKYGLEQHLQKPDAELVKECEMFGSALKLTPGWGGMALTVVRLF